MHHAKPPEGSAIKALAIDLDGTALLPDTRLGERTADCLRRLLARGIQAIICTGRAPESARGYCEAIGARGPMVFFNGAAVADMPGCEPLRLGLVPLEVIDYGLDVARGLGAHFQAWFPPGGPESGESRPGMRLVIEKPRPEADFYQKHTGTAAFVADIRRFAAEPGLAGAAKGMFITDPKLHGEIREKMLERFGERIYVSRTHPTFLEVMAAGVSKGEGLKTAAGLRGLDPAEIAAFGDEENDLPMFAVAGFSAAPSNARESVKRAADFIFGSNAEEGLAAFLEDLFP